MLEEVEVPPTVTLEELGEIVNAKLIVQALKDSKAQVMMAFLFAGHAMDVKEIQSWTGLKRQTVYQVLDRLGPSGLGFLGCQSLAHNRQVWLPAGEMLPLFQMSPKWTSDQLIDVVDESRSLLPSITTTITTIGQMSTKRTSEEMTALNATFKTYKISGKKREQLTACEWVSAEYVRAHCEHAKGEHWDNPVGMAITRMLDQEEQPATNENGHPMTCQCVKCKANDFMNRDYRERSKYFSGEYSDYIEH